MINYIILTVFIILIYLGGKNSVVLSSALRICFPECNIRQQREEQPPYYPQFECKNTSKLLNSDVMFILESSNAMGQDTLNAV